MTLSRENFDYVRTVLRERSAHVLEEDKAYLVEARLHSVARRHGLATVEELVRRLRLRADEAILSELVEAMTINETSFFRDGRPFEALRQSVLPELIRRRAEVRRLHVWSAACSSGQEPYSLALMLRHDFPTLAGWNVRIIASDLSAAMLGRARAGRYSELEVGRGLPTALRDTYFERHGHSWHLRDEIRRAVEFLPINLSGQWPAIPPLDLVLLRNVLIYFDTPTRQRILARIRTLLAPDGYLVLGGSETTHNLDDAYVPITFAGVSFFQQKA